MFVVNILAICNVELVWSKEHVGLLDSVMKSSGVHGYELAIQGISKFADGDGPLVDDINDQV